VRCVEEEAAELMFLAMVVAAWAPHMKITPFDSGRARSADTTISHPELRTSAVIC
jgi:hypothetical protein